MGLLTGLAHTINILARSSSSPGAGKAGKAPNNTPMGEANWIAYIVLRRGILTNLREQLEEQIEAQLRVSFADDQIRSRRRDR